MKTVSVVDHVGPLVKMLSNRLDAYMNAAAADMELTGTQTHILHYICRRSDENITQKKLEERFNVNHATLSGILSRLESKGFVSFESCSADRRKKYIRPTEKAYDCDGRMREAIERCETIIAEGIPDDELSDLRAALGRMIENINSVTEEGKQ